MKLLDYSASGIGTAFKKFFTVLGFVAISGVITALIGYFSNYQIDSANATQIAMIALVNASLATVGKFLTTIDPTVAPGVKVEEINTSEVVTEV